VKWTAGEGSSVDTDKLLSVVTITGYVVATLLLFAGRQTLSLVALAVATVLGALVAYRTVDDDGPELP
jgi:hypothetical protein